MLLFGSLLTFSNFSVGILSERWYSEEEKAEEMAGKMMAIMWGISSFLTPIFGYIIDKYKNRSLFVNLLYIFFRILVLHVLVA